MIKQNSQVIEQIISLKDLTKRTGALHEAQINQLRIWFQLLFDDIDPTTSTFTWDVDLQQVTYLLKTKIKRYLSLKQKELLILLNSIKFLLGEEWSLLFIVNGKKYAIRT